MRIGPKAADAAEDADRERLCDGNSKLQASVRENRVNLF